MMSLEHEISQTLLECDPPPISEAATCHRVVYPLLRAAGYTHRDIEPESTASPGQRPDYTILPGTEHEWYVEAKAWNAPLEEDRYLQQALDYANRHIKRWVVLTNGRLWRLYDNDLRGSAIRTAGDKLVAEASLEDSVAIHEFLQAVGKLSVQSGALERFALRTRLLATMANQLKSEQSELVRALWSTVRKEAGLENVTRRDIVEFLPFCVPRSESVEKVEKRKRLSTEQT